MSCKDIDSSLVSHFAINQQLYKFLSMFCLCNNLSFSCSSGSFTNPLFFWPRFQLQLAVSSLPIKPACVTLSLLETQTPPKSLNFIRVHLSLKLIQFSLHVSSCYDAEAESVLYWSNGETSHCPFKVQNHIHAFIHGPVCLLTAAKLNQHNFGMCFKLDFMCSALFSVC